MSELQTEIEFSNRAKQRAKKKKRNSIAFINFFMFWLLLIVAGFYGVHWYMNEMKQSIAEQVNQQVSEQMAQVQNQYEERLTKLNEQYTAELQTLQTKINSFNELLTFTKDNASSNTDNSNMLYSQLNELKKQINEMKNSLEMLK